MGKRFPRVRGDVPIVSDANTRGFRFSPHTRGCSWLFYNAFRRLAVFPAYAGMFRQLY